MQCRRHAPQGHIAPDRTDCSSYGNNWPSSDGKDWCGEWMKFTDIQSLSESGGVSSTGVFGGGIAEISPKLWEFIPRVDIK